MSNTEMKIKHLKEQYDQLGLFINLYQSNATIHAALRATIRNDEDLQKLFKVIAEQQLYLKTLMEKCVEDEISRHRVVTFPV